MVVVTEHERWNEPITSLIGSGWRGCGGLSISGLFVCSAVLHIHSKIRERLYAATITSMSRQNDVCDLKESQTEDEQ